jgi:hypothetical protein
MERAQQNSSNLIGLEATPSCSNRFNGGLFQRKKVKNYESYGQCFFWGGDLLKPDETKKKRKKEKGRCKRYKGGFFLKKWVQVDSS